MLLCLILKKVIEATLADSIEMLYFNLDRMNNSQSKGSLDSKIYKEISSKYVRSF